MIIECPNCKLELELTKETYWKERYLEILNELKENYHDIWVKIVNQKLNNIEEKDLLK